MYRAPLPPLKQPAGWESELALHPCSLTSAGSGPKGNVAYITAWYPANDRNVGVYAECFGTEGDACP